MECPAGVAAAANGEDIRARPGLFFSRPRPDRPIFPSKSQNDDVELGYNAYSGPFSDENDEFDTNVEPDASFVKSKQTYERPKHGTFFDPVCIRSKTLIQNES